MSSNLAYINPGGRQARKVSALEINLVAARGLQEVLKTNLGPRGTMKMLVSGAGLIKITKDGHTLLGEMQIQHPTAALIARAATAMDDIAGDGSTSTILVIGEMMRQCERYIQEGMHPRLLADGMRVARDEAVRFLLDNTLVVPATERREYLTNVAHTALATKVNAALSQQLAEAVVDAVLAVAPHVAVASSSSDDDNGDKKATTTAAAPVDLHMIEVMHMRHRLAADTRFVDGIVLDHGGRHSDMPKHLENAYILTCNVSLEYERSELASGFYYKDTAEKARMVKAESKLTEDRVRAIIALKRQVCTKENGRTFVVINQKGIDLVALEMFAREGILALRRAKRRNMERLMLACGGEAVNSTDNLTPDVLGEAGLVQEHTLGDDKYTFVERAKRGRSCTLLVKGPNDHTIAQIKDAIRDGLRAVKSAYEANAVVAGAGAFELALHAHLMRFADSVSGRQKMGVRAFADAVLVTPKTLAENSGLDVQQCLIALQDASAAARAQGKWAGLRIDTGDALDPVAAGILDNVQVKRNLLEATCEITAQLLLVDEVMKAGRRGAGGAPPQ